jgi:hypothetical protein
MHALISGPGRLFCDGLFFDALFVVLFSTQLNNYIVDAGR